MSGSLPQTSLIRGQSSLRFGQTSISTLSKGGGVTLLRREVDGTVTVLSIARVRPVSLNRESDGTVTVN